MSENIKMFLNGKYGEALKSFESLADQGDGRAMYFLGLYHATGYNRTHIDTKEAKKWYNMGEKRGDILATYMSMPVENRKNIKEKLRDEILRLAQSENVFAQRIIAEMFEKGYGFSVDNEAAFVYYLKAASGGFSVAMNVLALYYLNGNGCVEKDRNAGGIWCQQSAERGDAIGLKLFGDCSLRGFGVIKDRVKGNMCRNMAAMLGVKGTPFSINPDILAVS